MITLLKVLLVVASLFFCSQTATSQPSYSSIFIFRLYDGKGHIVNKAKFIKEYALRGLYGAPITISRNRKYPNNYYDLDQQYFVLHINRVPSLFTLSICHEKDTMTICLEGSASVYCDSLKFHKGRFLLGYECGYHEYMEVPPFTGWKFHSIKESDWECYRALFEKEEQDDPRLRAREY